MHEYMITTYVTMLGQVILLTSYMNKMTLLHNSGVMDPFMLHNSY